MNDKPICPCGALTPEGHTRWCKFNPDPPLTLEQRLEKLRESWSSLAEGIEKIHGNDAPTAKSIRLCIGDLYTAMHPDEF